MRPVADRGDRHDVADVIVTVQPPGNTRRLVPEVPTLHPVACRVVGDPNRIHRAVDREGGGVAGVGVRGQRKEFTTVEPDVTFMYRPSVQEPVYVMLLQLPLQVPVCQVKGR